MAGLVAQLEEQSDLDVTATDEPSPGRDLTEQEQYIIAALQEQPRSALRVVHRVATTLDGSPFEEFDDDDGWNEERKEIRDLLWSIKFENQVDNEASCGTQRRMPCSPAQLSLTALNR